MSTYNGERYLEAQIDSILAQKCVDVILLVRDDGSKDNTLKILDKYQDKHENIIVFKEQNLGCTRSFYKLVEYALQYKDVDFFAFSDQDDVWLPEKLINGLNHLHSFDNSIPALYFCMPKIVDADLKPMKQKWPSHHKLTYGEACIIQPIPGCTMIFNKVAASLFLKATPGFMRLHDSWMYKCVVFCGGKIVEDTNELMLYRQHSNNVVGANETFLHSLQRRYLSYTKRKNERLRTIRNFVKLYSREMSPEILQELENLIDYKKSIMNKLRVIFSQRYLSNNRISNILFKISVLTNRY